MSVVIKTYVQRFTLESAYDKRIADAAKSISGSRWFANRKIWSFPLSELENLKSALSKAEIIFSVEKGEWNKISSSRFIAFPYSHLNKQKVSEICAKHGFGFEYQVWSED